MLKHHFVHHRRQMLGCVAGALVAVLGGVLALPVLAIAGAVICGGFCLNMVRMTLLRPKQGEAAAK
jgi:hypothetical protein